MCAGWSGGGGDKLSRAFVFANSGWAEAALAHVWSGTSAGPDGNYLMGFRFGMLQFRPLGRLKKIAT